MKKILAVVMVVCFTLSFAGFAQAQKRDGEGRKKYLQQKESQIDKEYEKKIDKVRDGQKGMANSGATQKKIDQMEKERDGRKKELRDHYNKGPKAKGN